MTKTNEEHTRNSGADSGVAERDTNRNDEQALGAVGGAAKKESNHASNIVYQRSNSQA